MKTKTIKRTIYRIGDRSGDLAMAVGSGTVDIARRFGSGTSDLAHRIGPRRGLMGLAMLGVAVGGSIVLVRYLRRRKAAAMEMNGDREILGQSTMPGYQQRPRESAPTTTPTPPQGR